MAMHGNKNIQSRWMDLTNRKITIYILTNFYATFKFSIEYITFLYKDKSAIENSNLANLF